MGDLHGDDLDAIFAGQLEYVRQAVLAVPLERVRIGARLVGAHARAYLAVVAQYLHHLLDMLGVIYRAQPGEDIEIVLAEAHAVVFKMTGARVVGLMASEYAVFFGYAHRALYPRQALHIVHGQPGGAADQVNFSEQLRRALFFMYAILDTRQLVQIAHELLVNRTVRAGIGSEDEDHAIRAIQIKARL